MHKTTVYLPSELQARLDAEAAATGVTKAELIRRAVGLLLEDSGRKPLRRELPVIHGDRPKTVEEMDNSIYEHIKERAARR
ncbi:ribbon-helix-helix protein, CopG family [Marinactinospora rubrisoli]|uniref:Ribbon-helix-helix protein, CopG family n=1 Tax=Marinactinospora rubrisoli TaxID=2715399 RepID=A0ABW2K9E1_9ACTN